LPLTKKETTAQEGQVKEEFTCGRSSHPHHMSIASTHFTQISSGILFNSWDAHYRRVNVLKFINDGSILISGSEDSSVNVWLVQRYLILLFCPLGCRAQQFNLDSLTMTHKMICRYPASHCLIIHYLSQISSAVLVPL